MEDTTARDRFLLAATWHGSLDEAEALRSADPGLGRSGIHAAAILGDAGTVREFLARDPAGATVPAGPYGADPLTYLALSRYLRLDPARSPGFLDAATALLDAGADPNSGFWTTGEFPERETALYGAAGVAHHAALTRLLVERGADPNDEEAAYHSPEGYDLGALSVLVETGRMTAENLAMMLIRKHDWHHLQGVAYLLHHGADPNLLWRGRTRPFFHAVARDNSRAIIELLLEHGGDPTLLTRGRSVVELAARRGRGGLLALFESRGIPVELPGAAGLIAAAARDDGEKLRALRKDPALVAEVVAQAGTLLAEFAGTWNAPGVAHLLGLGIRVDSRYEGDPYFGIAPGSTALHVAAWKGDPATVRLLLAEGADVHARDGEGRTPLVLAVKACVDSYWTDRRTPDTVAALLEAGATLAGVMHPSGYEPVDQLLAARGA